MNTFAKAGRNVLSLFFAKKEIFSTTRYEEMGMVRVLPRKVIISKEPIDLEKEYMAHMVGSLGRENNYKIFLWNAELVLNEIILVSNEYEGKLIELMIELMAESTISTPTHIVIAEKKEWDDFSELDFNLGKSRDKAQQYSQEEVTIYSLNEKQKQIITSSVEYAKWGEDVDEEDFNKRTCRF